MELFEEEGFDIDRFKEKPADIFCCPVCTLIVHAPKECPTCGALFCSSCVDVWVTKRKDCPKSRCDITKFPIKNISGALLRIYNNLDVCCKFENCKQFKKMSDILMHQKNCQIPKCINFDICGNSVNNGNKEKTFCDPSCCLLSKVKNTNGNWNNALNEIKIFLLDYKNQPGKQKVLPFLPFLSPLPNDKNNNGIFNFKWDKKCMGLNIELTNNKLNGFLKESAYVFRTILGDQPMTSGQYYWEIGADERTENELKIGVSTQKIFNYNSAFCDYDFGYAYYGLGQLRHNSNVNGGQYGKKFKKEGVLGCFLDMNKGTLSFSLNDEYFGIAYQNEKLKNGPIYPAISVLHCAGFKLINNKPAPAYFFNEN